MSNGLGHRTSIDSHSWFFSTRVASSRSPVSTPDPGGLHTGKHAFQYHQLLRRGYRSGIHYELTGTVLRLAEQHDLTSLAAVGETFHGDPNGGTCWLHTYAGLSGSVDG